MASHGQSIAHRLHPVQASGLIIASPVRLKVESTISIHLAGQMAAHIAHPVQLAESTNATALFLLVTLFAEFII